LENECQDLVEEPATAETKGETAHSLRAGDVGAPSTPRSVVPTDQKRRNGSTPEATWNGGRNVTCLLKARIVKPAEMAVARE
jgi:hypothetical protein